MNTELIIIVFSIFYITISIIELIGLHKFNLNFYKRGFNIFNKEITIKSSNWKNLDGVYSEKAAKYVFIPDLKEGFFVTKFYFTKRYSVFASSQGFPLTIFGRFYIDDGKLFINYLISYRIIILIGLWFLFWVITSITSENLNGIGIGIAGILFSLFLLYIIKIFQMGKMLTMSDEIIKILNIKE